MASSTLGVAWYCLRVTFRAHRRSYAAIALLIGLLGGLSMASVAAARRTQSSYPALLAASHTSQVFVVSSILNPLLGSDTGYNAPVVARLARLPHVVRAASEVGVNVYPVGANDVPIPVPGSPPEAGDGVGSLGGEFFSQDRLSAVEGRLANPARADEIDVDPQVAKAVGWRVGQRVRMGVYTNAQTNLPAFGTAGVKPNRVVTVTVVGLAIEPHQVVEDDTDYSPSLAVFTPAFTAGLIRCCVNYAGTSFEVSDGSTGVDSVVSALPTVLPMLYPTAITVGVATAKAERAIKPESIALGVFGGIAGLAALLIAFQLIGRQLRRLRPQAEVLRAVGAGPVAVAAPGVLGAVVASTAGALLALALAVSLSPLAPLGPVRPIYPDPGISADWTVLGLGSASLFVLTVAAAAVMAVRAAPHRSRTRPSVVGAGATVARAAAAGLPPPAVTGIHFALDPGTTDAVPVRSAILGATLAVVVLVSTVVFGASLDHLVATPALYGWNWDYVLDAGAFGGNVPGTQATRLLGADRYVTAWSGVYFAQLGIDGQVVGVMGEDPGAAVQPPILSGHDLESGDQVVLGAITLAQLHKRVGDTVEVNNGGSHAVRLRIVGTATMPTMGSPGSIHPEMGTGMLMPTDLIPPAARNPFHLPGSGGPEAVLVRVKGGLPVGSIPSSSTAIAAPIATGDPAVRSLVRIGDQLTNNFDFGVTVSPVLRPAEIVNYRSLGTTPAILGGALAVGAVSALGLTLVASVRRRRRELALLKTLGFTGPQLASVVSWQASVAVGLGTTVGLPVGIVVGRALWTLFAESIDAVPSPVVPISYLVVIAAGTLVLANVVATLPGRMAARTSTALLLRSE